MITTSQIEEWLREIEARPSSAEMIIRNIAARLAELDEKNQALLAENIALQSGEKVDEYDERIANLEYQLDLLKRQVGDADVAPQADTLSLLIYNAKGQILRLGLAEQALSNEMNYANFDPVKLARDHAPQFQVVDIHEELLVVFDSGRVVSMPVTKIGTTEINEARQLDWSQAFIEEPRGGETLAAILPIARMALYGYCVQVSRRGYVKKYREAFLEACISRANVGSGVVLPSDRTFKLALCNQEDVLVLVSREGQLLSAPVGQVPFTIEEAARLRKTDHIVSAFIPAGTESFMAVTQNGKIFNRQFTWLAVDEDSKTQKKSILTKARRDAGTRIIAADVVDPSDWSLVITADGRITIYQVSELFARGALPAGGDDSQVISFTTFSIKKE